MDEAVHGVLEAKYANLFRVGYNAFEVIVEFGQSYPGEATDLIHSRIATTPSYARAFLRMLDCSLEEYEREFGAMPEVTSG